jgi:hypothetical protein
MTKFKVIVILHVLIFALNCKGQTSNIWPFGYKSALVFQPSGITLLGKSSITRCGMDSNNYSSVSSVYGDCKGKVVLYANDGGIWNGSNSTVEGGEQIGNCGSFEYGTKAALIIPNPKKSNIYYLFYTGIAPSPNRNRLMMAYIDMAQNAGRGKVLFKDSLFAGELPASRNLTYAYHKNGRDIWLVTTPDESHVHAYLIDSLGLNTTPIISNVFNEMARFPAPNGYLYSDTNNNDAFGAGIVFSKDQKNLITYGVFKKTISLGNVLMYDFNDSTGKFTFNKTLFTHSQKPANTFCSAACFSPNDSILYVYFAANDLILGYYSYLMAVNRYTSVKTQIRRFPFNFKGKSVVSYHNWMTNLTLAPDNRIYSFMAQDIWRIEKPNVWGPGCMYRYWDSSKTQIGATEGLPRIYGNIKSTYFEFFSFQSKSACQDTTQLVYKGEGNFDFLIINWGDNTTDTIPSRKVKFGTKWKHLYEKDGSYGVTVGGSASDCEGYFTYTDTVEVKRNPILQRLNVDTSFSGCRIDTLVLRWKYSNAKFVQVKYDDKNSDVFYNPDSAMNLTFRKQGNQTVLTSATGNNGCKIVDTLWVQPKFIAKPVYMIKFDSTFCDNEKLNIQVNQTSNADSFHVSVRNAYWRLSVDSFKVSTFGLSPGIDTFSVVAFYPISCTDTQYFVYTINKSPKISITTIDDLKQCSSNAEWNLMFKTDTNTTAIYDTIYWPSTGTKTKLNDQYLWNSRVPGQHTIKYVKKDTLGCIDSQELVLTVLANPMPTVVVLDSLCSNKSLQLTLQDTLALQRSVIYFDAKDSIVISTPKQSEVLYHNTFTNFGNLKIHYLATAKNGCTSQIIDSVFIKKSPEVRLEIYDSTQCLLSNLITIQDTFAGKKSIIWGDGNKDSILSEHSYKSAAIYNIQLAYIANNGCKDTAWSRVRIIKNPVVSFHDSQACVGVLTPWNGVVTLGEAPLEKSFWVFNGSDTVNGVNIDYRFNSSGNVRTLFFVVDSMGCADSVSKVIRISDIPKVSVAIKPLNFLNETAFYEFKAAPDSFLKYEWDVQHLGVYNGNPIQMQFANLNKVYPVALTVTNGAGCEANFVDSCFVFGITGFYFPNAISINGDGLNEKFGISGPEFIKEIELTIFNKWGEKIFETRDPYDLWIPKEELAGAYVYVCKVTDVYNRKRRVNGTVYLIR